MENNNFLNLELEKVEKEYERNKRFDFILAPIALLAFISPFVLLLVEFMYIGIDMDNHLNIPNYTSPWLFTQTSFWITCLVWTIVAVIIIFIRARQDELYKFKKNDILKRLETKPLIKKIPIKLEQKEQVNKLIYI